MVARGISILDNCCTRSFTLSVASVPILFASYIPWPGAEVVKACKRLVPSVNNSLLPQSSRDLFTAGHRSTYTCNCSSFSPVVRMKGKCVMVQKYTVSDVEMIFTYFTKFYVIIHE